MNTRAEAFLRRHNMHYEQMPFAELVDTYEEDMRASLAGTGGTLPMIPTYMRSDTLPRRGESLLVIDAGGTNLRVGRIHFDGSYRPVIERMEKHRMPGSYGVEISIEEMFRQMAEYALPYADCQCACISFSYAFDCLPDGDGKVRGLCKEVKVRGCSGQRIGASLEAQLQALGAAGERRWTVVNDSVGGLLGGMSCTDTSLYAGFLGLILGTGYNCCCSVPAREVTKDPVASALPGEMVMNMEAGYFRGLLLGDADRELDAASELPGDHLCEKMVAGTYLPRLLKRTLLLAAREGELDAGAETAIAALSIRARNLDELCVGPVKNSLVGRALRSAADREFAVAVNDALLERSARVVAAGLCAAIRHRGYAPGSRIGICADGSMLRKSPVLQPKLERYLRENAPAAVDILYVEDATLLGNARAGLLER